MKNNYLDKNFKSRPEIQTSLYMQSSYPARNSSSRDISLERNGKRISPAPHQRFTQAPTPLVFPSKRYSSNEYQMTPRISEFVPTSDNTKFIQDLLQRIQKLQAKSQKMQKLDARVERLQEQKLRTLERSESHLGLKEWGRGKQNNMNAQNRQQQLRKRCQMVTKQELKKEMLQLNDAFKHVFDVFKTTISTEMGEYNTKSKKKFIQITATQLSQKLQSFKNNFIKEYHQQIQSLVKDIWNKQTKVNLIGLSKEKFITTPTCKIKMKQQLVLSTQNSQKELASQQTLYYLDRSGYLLDHNMFYLLDGNQQQIRLGESHLQALRKQGVMIAPMKQPSLSKSKSFL